MKITYKDTHTFSAAELEKLFGAVKWESGNYPEKLQIAMQGFKTVFSAWDGDRLVGLCCAMDDGILNAYVQYLLVDPAYHNRGIGSTLIACIKETYRDYLRVVLLSYSREVRFYESCGFGRAIDAAPMFLTDLRANLQDKD